MRKALAGLVAAALAVTGMLTMARSASAVAYTITVSEGSVNEGGTLNVTFTLSPAPSDTVTTQFGTTPFTATGGGTDYANTNGTITWNAGGPSTQTANVPTVQDSLVEGNEQFFIDEVTPTCTPVPATNPPCSVSYANQRSTQTIVDDDTTPLGFSINDVTANEGNAGNTTFAFTVTMNGATPGCTYGITYATGGGTATPNVDYVSTTGTFANTTFSNAAPTQVVNVPVIGDTTTEPDETFNVTLSNPTITGCANPAPAIADNTGIGTIKNDDGAVATTTPTATPTPQTLAIGDDSAGKHGDCALVVTRSGGTTGTVTVNYSVSDPKGQVKSSSPASPLSFGPGVATQTINLDMKHKKNETAVVTLSGAVGAAITDATGNCDSKKK